MTIFELKAKIDALIYDERINGHDEVMIRCDDDNNYFRDINNISVRVSPLEEYFLIIGD